MCALACGSIGCRGWRLVVVYLVRYCLPAHSFYHCVCLIGVFEWVKEFVHCRLPCASD